LRESPETAKYHAPPLDCCGADTDSCMAVWASASETSAHVKVNPSNAAQKILRRFIEPPASFCQPSTKKLSQR
jgi:hypothetical protein